MKIIVFFLGITLFLSTDIMSQQILVEIMPNKYTKSDGLIIYDASGKQVGLYSTSKTNYDQAQIHLPNNIVVPVQYFSQYSVNVDQQKNVLLEESSNSHSLSNKYSLRCFDFLGNPISFNEGISTFSLGNILKITREGRVFVTTQIGDGSQVLFYFDENNSLVWSDTLQSKQHISEHSIFNDETYLYTKILSYSDKLIRIHIRELLTGRILFKETFDDHYFLKNTQDEGETLTLFSNENKLIISVREGKFSTNEDWPKEINSNIHSIDRWFFFPLINSYLYISRETKQVSLFSESYELLSKIDLPSKTRESFLKILNTPLFDGVVIINEGNSIRLSVN